MVTQLHFTKSLAMISFFKLQCVRVVRLIQREVLRDAFLLAIKRWFQDQGDKTLRLDYPLTRKSVVWDLGGYEGQFAHEIHAKYGCKVMIFEPHPTFAKDCIQRFLGNKNIDVFSYGLSDTQGHFNIHDSADGSSFLNPQVIQASSIQAELRDVVSTLIDMNTHHVDLIKINIEGGEFPVLQRLLATGDIKKFRYIQVQFHNFIPNAQAMRDSIREKLTQTHEEMWNYTFVWESWRLKSENGAQA
jgi:FkbM family methyltransferase